MTKEDRKPNTPVFPNAASPNLRFPQWGDITSAEILAFLPSWLRSHDVTFRLVSNGATNQTIATMVNYYRDHDEKGEVPTNTICKMVQKSMRDHDYVFPEQKMVEGVLKVVNEPWTISRHVKNDVKSKSRPWDEQNLSLANGKPQCQHDLGEHNNKKDTLIQNVPMASLANGVKRFPSVESGDGLNLTRCVQYAHAHQEEDLMFPRDFKDLTEWLGPTPVGPKHYDAATFERFKGGKTPNPPSRVRSVAARIWVPQQPITARPALANMPQAKVGKSYKTTKEQIKASRASTNKQECLENLSDKGKLVVADMANIIPYQPSSLAGSGKGKEPRGTFPPAAHCPQSCNRALISPFSLFDSPHNEQFSPLHSWKLDASMQISQHPRSFADIYAPLGGFQQAQLPLPEHHTSKDAIMSNSADENDPLNIMQVVDDLDLGPLTEGCMNFAASEFPDVSTFPSFSTHPPIDSTSSATNPAVTGRSFFDSASGSQALVPDIFAARTDQVIDPRLTNDFAPVAGPSGSPGSIPYIPIDPALLS